MGSYAWRVVETRIGDNGGFYSVHMLAPQANGIDALREFFPAGTADEMNFVLFSTSGVHGGYTTIEEAEAGLPDTATAVTFLIVCPRMVSLYYGNVTPRDIADIEFLKRLRQSSWSVASQIGAEK